MTPKNLLVPGLALAVALTAVLPGTLGAQSSESGQVELPLDTYDTLVESARDPKRAPRPAPAGHALGSARVAVTVTGDGSRLGARVTVELAIRVLEEEWVAIPVLPSGTAVEKVSVGGTDVQLLSTVEGLAWSVRKPGAYTMSLAYRVDAARSEAGWSLALPLPRAAAITLTADLPGTGLDVAVIPSAGTRSERRGADTRLTATVPTTSGVQISWRVPARQGHALSRALYTGRLAGGAVTWKGELDVELFSDETVTLPLLPKSVTLNDVTVDGEQASILLDGDRFATLVQGRGRHLVAVGFEVPVVRRDGPPRIDLRLPPVPVSRFDLTLPGKKEVTVTPSSNVTTASRGGATIATAHVPLTETVSITWAEAVPEEIRTEVRANAGLYHVFYAEEGVLYARALIDYEVSRGETNVVRLTVPAEVQVDRISAPSGAVADWRLGDESDGGREVAVFLDRQLQGSLVLEVAYDRALGDAGEEIEVPLVRSLDAQRQRGMVALLSTQDLALEPVTEADLTRVGENQLPAFVRQSIEHSVAHTYKYIEVPRLVVQAAAPERQQGRFDAQVDTLISLGEVSLKGSASVEVDVKSGRIMELALDLPAAVSLLSLTGPSVRDHSLEVDGDAQRIDVEFTQEMEGQFRLEVAYERILVDSQAEIPVPTLAVRGAEVEQGRIAVEALSAVEVRPSITEQLTSLDTSELPQQLILRTTNPILHAYKYVHPAYRLGLTVTRHEVVEVHEAAIDRAEYRTLYTKDGLSVTSARFLVRNSREQFLRVKLPAGSEVWSAFVDGRPEKPARTTTDDGEEWHLIKIIHSTQGFPVELIFQTSASEIRGLGTVAGVLPRPEILVTESRWDVYVPAGVSYGEPSDDMSLVSAATPVTAVDLRAELDELAERSAAQAIEPLRLVVPTAGVHFAFEKIYANQGGRDTGFSIPYASGFGGLLGRLLSFVATLSLWAGLGLLARRQRRLGGVLTFAGVALLALLIGRYQVSAAPAVWLSVLLLLAGAAVYGKAAWDRRREAEADD
ncbi:MAG: hypothetical protein V3T72_22265 [Thermoanaerobaculia bacterium]